MKLHEIADVEEERLPYIESVMKRAGTTRPKVKDVVEVVREELVGTERDYAMMVIGTRLIGKK